ncbi:unnamed protein product [Strongylus vulgaris]|uniref:C2H2-type domain-containing protein n=1 Tax=Strongylus vulgaris TaxID=40348 RepID=A0A3P7JX84_STRVU|nr:unnamed protein product [Strongylus vulgaris]
MEDDSSYENDLSIDNPFEQHERTIIQQGDRMDDNSSYENDLSIDNPYEQHERTIIQQGDRVGELAAEPLSAFAPSPEEELDIEQLQSAIAKLKNIHELGEKSQCMMCIRKQEVCSEAHAFLNHVNRVHAKIQLYGCLYCNFAGASKCSVKLHLRAHRSFLNLDVKLSQYFKIMP